MSSPFINNLFNGGAMPALERLSQFTSARHKVLTHNIANLSTPYFKPRDLDVHSFQQAMANAVDKRRSRINPTAGPLEVQSTSQLDFQTDRLAVKAAPLNNNILFHDQNNRNVERTMQHLVENTMVHNMGIELLRSELNLLRMAMRGRV